MWEWFVPRTYKNGDLGEGSLLPYPHYSSFLGWIFRYFQDKRAKSKKKKSELTLQGEACKRF